MVLRRLTWQGGVAGFPPASRSFAAPWAEGCTGSVVQVSLSPCVWDKLESVSTQMGHSPSLGKCIISRDLSLV